MYIVICILRLILKMIEFWIVKFTWLCVGLFMLGSICVLPFIESEYYLKSIAVFVFVCFYSIPFFTITLSTLSCLFYYCWLNWWKKENKKDFIAENISSGIVLPPDIDLFFQMSSEAFMKAMQIALFCTFLKCGTFEFFLDRKAFAGISATLTKYVKPLGLFQRYKIKTKLIYWDDGNFYFDQNFIDFTDETKTPYFSALVAVQTINCTTADLFQFCGFPSLQRPFMTAELRHFVNLTSSLLTSRRLSRPAM